MMVEMSKIDLLIKNANILTLDNQNRRAGSVAISKGKIVGIWRDGEPPTHEVKTAHANVVDLQGATLIPGFIDTNNYMLMYGEHKEQLDCSPSRHKTIKSVLDAIGRKAKTLANGEWIKGYGYDETLILEKRQMTSEDIDRVSPNNPVMISYISAQIASVNSLALQLAGVREDVCDPRGGHFGRNVKGQLNGVLYDTAIQVIQTVLPKRTIADLVKSLQKAAKDYLAQGITTTDVVIYSPVDFEAHLVAAKHHVNPIRTRLMVMHPLLQQEGMYSNYTAEQLNNEMLESSGGRVKLDGAKIVQDGSIQALTAALRQPYYEHTDITGEFNHSQEDLNKMVLDFHQRGYRIAAHGNGDRAIGSIIEAYAFALTMGEPRDHRHRIEHVQTATTGDINTMKKLGITASFSINHVFYWGDRHLQINLGPERAMRMNPLRDAVNANLLFTLHSDCPVTPISPLFSVWAAVNRLSRDGVVLGPEQQIDVVTALKSMTLYGARLNFDEAVSGSIEIGKNADFAVLEADPTTVRPEEIKDIMVLATYIDGHLVYEQ